MSCSADHGGGRSDLPQGWHRVLADEGFRLFFPLSALYAAFWPLMWVLALGFDLPLADTVPPSLWHAHEMLVGAFGAALIGFLTTAAPEWTDTRPWRGRPLLGLAALWLLGRVVGVLGWDGMGALGALADLAWMLVLLGYLIWLSWDRQTDKLVAFVFWMGLLIGCTGWTRYAFVTGDIEAATSGVVLIGLAFLGLLGLALARITVPVTNLVLDPSEETSPFRPHPGRLHLASGLVVVAMAGEAAGLSPAVSGFLFFAAGAAFMDRVAEAFIGWAVLRAEILMLAGSSIGAGLGLMLTGAARLGAPWGEVAGLHVALMGGLGLGVLAVFCIAGLLHTNQPLGLAPLPRQAAVVLAASVVLRVSPDMFPALDLPFDAYAASSLLWAAAFLMWLGGYLPTLIRIDERTSVLQPTAAE